MSVEERMHDRENSVVQSQQDRLAKIGSLYRDLMQLLEEKRTTSYDEIPYESHAFSQSHPDRLAAIGTLFGMMPAPVDNCRVLELGCASGGNLIPMAYHLPGSKFIGIDASRRQVDMAQETVLGLGLTNCRIEQTNISDIDQDWGTFDYIICHGVFSWVPDAIQEKILSIAASNLNPEGIAYISYNTYPGWHMREMIRRMMLYHAGQFTDTNARIQQARALIDFLAQSAASVKDSSYDLMLKNELEIIKQNKDYYLFHEHLEENNAPVYFYQFAERADRHGLQYLAEAEFNTMLTGGFSKDVIETLHRISPQIVQREQYMDFLRNRMFRQTLLCRRDRILKRNLGPQSIQGLLVASSASTEHGGDTLQPGKEMSFRTSQGASLRTGRAVTQAAFFVLKEHWPRAVGLDDLVSEAGRKLGLDLTNDEQARSVLFEDLLQCYTANVVEFHTWQADYPNRPPDCPRLSKLTAYQIAHGLPQVNQRHESMSADIILAQMALFFDGTRNRRELLLCMEELVGKGTLVLRRNNEPITDPDLMAKSLESALDKCLSNMATMAVLEK